MDSHRMIRRVLFLLTMPGLVLACKHGDDASQGTKVAHPANDWHSDKQKAEYAFRWRLPQTGLDSAEQTVQWLQDHAGFVNPRKEESRSVTYFNIVAPPGLPEPFEASFRQRGTDDYTYKVRGPAPWPSTDWAIPACARLKVDSEHDVAIGADGKVDDVKASHSCDGTSLAAFGDVFANTRPQARPCRITMERTRLDWSAGAASDAKGPKELKVEQWSFTSPKDTTENLVEISWKGKASQPDNERFSALVKSLPKGFPEALPLGKEKRAEACDVNG